MNNEGCVIYALCEPDTGEIRYVGKANDLPSRIRCHRFEKHDSRIHTRKINWLRSLGDREPVVRVLASVSREEWAQTERRWIRILKQAGARLTNYADGGQTSPTEGRGHTEESKAKMRAAALRNGSTPPSRKGHPVTLEARENMRQASLRRKAIPPMMGGWNKGKAMSAEFVETMRRARKGIPWSSARRAAQERRTLCVKEG